MRRLFRHFPVTLAATVLAVAGLLTLVNAVLNGTGLGNMKLMPGLIGVIRPEVTPLSVHSVLDGRFQASYARRVGGQMPFYPGAVRLRNQLAYWLFHQTSVPAVMLGRGDVLLETAYAEEYCSRDIAAWRPGAVEWAASIRRMQDWYERRGKAFLYVLTPSKVAQYPGILPLTYHCPSSPADRTGLVPAWLAILREAGVHVADTVTPVTQAHAAYPFPLYPPGGTHWNTVGAAIGLQTVFRHLDAARPGQGFAPYTFTWRLDPHPSERDRDLARLMDLIWPIDTAPVPEATLSFPPAPACPARRIVIVGGSFAEFLGEQLAAAPCQDTVHEYEYWHTVSLSWPGPHAPMLREPVNTAERDAAVLGADVMIYEENEQVLSDPAAGRALYGFLERFSPD